ncbi:hypothetical protein J3R30DRAFT_649095 [Lentinula aciculospora]|uniref:C2H2-type domain-containing protein n=1 Tax=Lentinula aciculospora TaxID=153920 RepID=A0A9W9A733_9AGAR|nr:hypothetical protein J3R30DRAFT_649095 [Lentinula aciculospora]
MKSLRAATKPSSSTSGLPSSDASQLRSNTSVYYPERSASSPQQQHISQSSSGYPYLSRVHEVGQKQPPTTTIPLASNHATSSKSNSTHEVHWQESTHETSSLRGKPGYICDYCGKAFLRPSALKTHVISHTGDQDFVCPEVGCSRRFGVRSNMLRHVRLVHRNLRYSSGEPLSQDEWETGS